jgi:hypothetical protein
MENDIRAYERLREALRWLSRGTPEGSALVMMTFPELDGRTAKPFATAKRYYTASEANHLLSTASWQLKKLREAKALRFEKLPSNVRLRARYDADDVDALKAAMVGTTSLGGAATTLDVPVYAIGQLADVGRLKLRNQPGVVALRGVQICAESIADLIRGFAERKRPAATRNGWITLREAIAGNPGEKPWGRIVDAMLSNRIPYEMDEGEFSTRRIMVDPTRIPTFPIEPKSVTIDPTCLTRVSLRDAYEILGASDEEAIASIRSAKLVITQDGRRKSVDRRTLWSLVSQIAFTGEVAAFMHKNPVAMHHQLRRLGIPRVHCAWSRPALMALGMVLPVNFREADLIK